VVNAQAALNVHEDPTLCLRQLSLQHVLERLVLCRCVDRFDHHCPAICNCVGKGNQRTYTAWLTVLLLAQILFLHLSCLFCARVARHHWNTAGQHDRGGFTDLWPGLSLVYRLHPGKVLLIVIEVSSVYWVGAFSQSVSFWFVGLVVQCVVSGRIYMLDCVGNVTFPALSVIFTHLAFSRQHSALSAGVASSFSSLANGLEHTQTKQKNAYMCHSLVLIVTSPAADHQHEPKRLTCLAHSSC